MPFTVVDVEYNGPVVAMNNAIHGFLHGDLYWILRDSHQKGLTDIYVKVMKDREGCNHVTSSSLRLGLGNMYYA